MKLIDQSFELIIWIIHRYDGTDEIINQTELIIESFNINHEATELINLEFEGYGQTLTGYNFNGPLCGPDRTIQYKKADIESFHIQFVQHYERIVQKTRRLQIHDVGHENEGHYECVVRLKNDLIGIRVFFLTVGGGPRRVPMRETHFYADVGDQTTLLCPIYTDTLSQFAFTVPNEQSLENDNYSPQIGQDYLRIQYTNQSNNGVYICDVNTMEGRPVSLQQNIELEVFDAPYYIEPLQTEYIVLQVEKNIVNIVKCSIGGNPNPTFIWYDGIIVNQPDSRKPLAFTNEYQYIPNEMYTRNN
ncbi:unnamed protein product, partial [Didymodactylos carnosus]